MFDVNQIDVKSKQLQEVAQQLKQELFGMDEIIDKIVNSIRAWYTFPELIQRPVIVNLWGLTGVGKTQLVRRLAQLLHMQDLFVEVQMDGITSSNSNTETTIANVLAGSAIEEGQPGILLLDEFQRFRAIDQDGGDVKAERFQDVWMLLSDGKFAADAGLFREIEMMIAQNSWSADLMSVEEPEEVQTRRGRGAQKKATPLVEKKRKYSIYPWEASRLKKQLKLTENIHEIMAWDSETMHDKIEYVKKNKVGLQSDYSKLLIFVSGNLDEAYAVANSVNDCDTDADIFYKVTKRIGVTEIKRALAARFKPEQISRLGNNHIVYPSIKKETYQKLIENTCFKYTSGMEKLTGMKFTVDQSTLDEIYENSVYPAQGTRPVFSSVHKIFSDALVQIAFKAIQDDINDITLFIDPKKSVLKGVSGEWVSAIHIDLDIRAKRATATEDFNTLVAVHEAGHALVYALLNKAAPAEVKINTASFQGGYMIPTPNMAMVSKNQMLTQIAVSYAGAAAEELVFGSEMRTAGSASDLVNASRTASMIVRSLGMDEFASIVGNDESDATGSVPRVTYIKATDDAIERIVRQQKQRATDLLESNIHLLTKLVHRLLTGDVLTADEFQELFKDDIAFGSSLEEPFAKTWEYFTMTPSQRDRAGL